MKWLISKKVRAVNTGSATTETADRRNRVAARGKEGKRPEKWDAGGERGDLGATQPACWWRSQWKSSQRRPPSHHTSRWRCWWGRRNLTVLLGQLYFSKISWARSSPPSVNIIIILLQLALGALVSWGTGGRGRGREKEAGQEAGRKKNRGNEEVCDRAREDVTHIHSEFSPSGVTFVPGVSS